jgi:hypothetical protein
MFDEDVDERFEGIDPSIYTSLRKRDVTIDGRPGQELCRVATEEGRRVYKFRLKVPSPGRDLARPQLDFEIYSIFDEDGTHDYGNGFASDAEAIEVWNAIRDSIRLRPGAV